MASNQIVVSPEAKIALHKFCLEKYGRTHGCIAKETSKAIFEHIKRHSEQEAKPENPLDTET